MVLCLIFCLTCLTSPVPYSQVWKIYVYIILRHLTGERLELIPTGFGVNFSLGRHGCAAVLLLPTDSRTLTPTGLALEQCESEDDLHRAAYYQGQNPKGQADGLGFHPQGLHPRGGA
jgi:hypothetical protein